MKMTHSVVASIFAVTMVLSPVVSFAGQGRDGGWPQSIQLLKVAKQNLLELISQATDQDVKDAINGMHDRDATYRPDQINATVLKDLVSRVQELDVLDIEKSTYSGVKLFDYSGENTTEPKIFATKNFYNSDRYGKPIQEVTVSLVKEVQRLILHEVSHLWGFGEETPETNYAEKFAVKMVAILHGVEKINFSPEERMRLLGKAYEAETHNPVSRNSLSLFDGKEMFCGHFTKEGSSSYRLMFDRKDYYESLLNGLEYIQDRRIVGRATIDNYLIFNNLDGYDVCHSLENKTFEVEDRFVKRYYSRSNLLTDLDSSSTTIFKILVQQSIDKVVDAFNDWTEIQNKNMDQIVFNIDVKIKKDRSEDYEWLIGLKRKHTKDKDSQLTKEFSKILNQDMFVSDLNPRLQILMDQLYSQYRSMKNLSRANFLRSILGSFMKDFNSVMDDINKEAMVFRGPEYLKCSNEKKVGQFYECQFEVEKSKSLSRKKFLEDKSFLIKKIQKKYSMKVDEYID